MSIETILLVEDDPDDVLLIKRAFKRAGLGHSLQVATHGEEAVDYLAGDGGFADRDKHPFPASYLVKPVSFDALLDMVQVVERYWLALAERPEAPRARPSR